MFESLLEWHSLGQNDGLAIDYCTSEALRAEFAKQFGKLTFLLVNNLREQLESGALRHFENLVDDLLWGLLHDSLATFCAEGNANSRP